MTPEQRFTKIENALNAMVERDAKHEEEIRENREAHKELRKMHKSLVVAVLKMAEAQRETQTSLKELKETVDRILGKQQN